MNDKKSWTMTGPSLNENGKMERNQPIPKEKGTDRVKRGKKISGL